MDIYRRIRAAYAAYTGEKRVIGRSHEGRALFAFRMGEGSPVGIAVYAIHAREYITALLALEHLKRPAVGTVFLVPLANPDGALLVEKGISSVRSTERREFLLALNGGEDFSMWKANIRGVDCNVNFPARWGEGKRNVFAPAPSDYVGECPFSERETRALAAFTLNVRPDYTLSFHTKGEELYWHFHERPVRLFRDYLFARVLSRKSGYPLRETPASAGGYKDWCISALKIPAVTVEVGSDALPHPLQENALPQILRHTGDILSAAGKTYQELPWTNNSCARRSNSPNAPNERGKSPSAPSSS